ncbi:activity-regulated cytoskeleton associated protein 2-like [Zophobas morio]|uniref:activity-regulated cytoskeleton associated protein 2-like n=1 Tax=Zophobas morio TaxID=2755281 RepID=UPI003082A64A
MARLPTAAAPVLNVAPTNHRRTKWKNLSPQPPYFAQEGISNEDALEGLPLLLTGTAHTWWKGVKLQIKTWDEAMKRLQEVFAPRKTGYKIYLEIFEEKQVANMSTDLFITRKRSLLSQIEQPLEEAVQLDVLF